MLIFYMFKLIKPFNELDYIKMLQLIKFQSKHHIRHISLYIQLVIV